MSKLLTLRTCHCNYICICVCITPKFKFLTDISSRPWSDSDVSGPPVPVLCMTPSSGPPVPVLNMLPSSGTPVPVLVKTPSSNNPTCPEPGTSLVFMSM